MILLGLTGGIGMGKSACAELLRGRGIPVVDTDDLARQVVEPGQPALAEVRARFGASVVDSEGRLRRDELGRRVFADENARSQLEDILHPRIRQLWRAAAEHWRGQNQPLGVIVIPLLFETHAGSEFDAILCVACSAATQLERLRQRGWSDREVEDRNRAQLPVEQKIARATYVIWTEGGLDIHAAQLQKVLEGVSAKKSNPAQVGGI